MGSVSFDKAKMDQLQVAYDKAVAAGDDQFVFEGHELLTQYAKYLLEYLETKLK